MGCCAVDRMIKVSMTSTTPSHSSKLGSDIRENLLSTIRYLHSVGLLCADEIEECIINHDKKSVILLKQKRFCIKLKLKEAQEIAERLSNCLEAESINIRETKRIEKRLNTFNEDLKKRRLFDKEVKISSQDEEYLETLMKEMLQYNINKTEIETEIEKEFKMRELNERQCPFIRRKYKKNKTIV